MERSTVSSSAPSVARNSVARLLSDGFFLISSLVIGVITARAFGPEGKGTYAVLMSLLMLFGTFASLGLGDAAVVLIGRDAISPRRVFGMALLPLIVASTVVAALVYGIGVTYLDTNGPTLGHSILVTCLSIPVVAGFHTAGFILNAQERIIATSGIRTVVQSLTVVFVVIFVALMGLHVTGGMMATGASWFAGLLICVALLKGAGVVGPPVWDAPLLRRGLRLGFVIQLAHSLSALAERVDVVLVFWLSGRAAAGRYSVALTMGQLVTFASLALSFALFPRVARLSATERMAVVARASRLGLATSAVSVLLLLLIVPVVTPLAFGSAFSSAVGPALILLPGGVFWAEQSLLSRSRTAAGHTGLQLTAYGSTLAVMVAVDLLLVPPLGATGAALGSSLGAAVGLLVCVRSYRHLIVNEPVSFARFLPGREDFRYLLEFVSTSLRLRRSAV